MGCDLLTAIAATRHDQTIRLDVHFISPAPVERHARAGGHPVPMALVSWIPAYSEPPKIYRDDVLRREYAYRLTKQNVVRFMLALVPLF